MEFNMNMSLKLKVEADSLKEARDICNSIVFSSAFVKGVKYVNGGLPTQEEDKCKVESVSMYDYEEVYTDCTVQYWRNTLTGDDSIGWYPSETTVKYVNGELADED